MYGEKELNKIKMSKRKKSPKKPIKKID